MNEIKELDESLKFFLKEQEEGVHLAFIKNNIDSFLSRRKLCFSMIINKIPTLGNKMLSFISLVDEKGKEIHRFIFSNLHLTAERNGWIEKELPVTMLPSGIESKNDVLLIKFHLGERLEHIAACACK